MQKLMGDEGWGGGLDPKCLSDKQLNLLTEICVFFFLMHMGNFMVNILYQHRI